MKNTHLFYSTVAVWERIYKYNDDYYSRYGTSVST